jgi:hypothetical protein
MFLSFTHVFGFFPSQAANWPSHWQPLYFTHSSLPAAGYDSYRVLRAVFHVRPGASQLEGDVLPPGDDTPPAPSDVGPGRGAPLQPHVKPKSNRGVTHRGQPTCKLLFMVSLRQTKGRAHARQSPGIRPSEAYPHGWLAAVGATDTAVP